MQQKDARWASGREVGYSTERGAADVGLGEPVDQACIAMVPKVLAALDPLAAVAAAVPGLAVRVVVARAVKPAVRIVPAW